MTSKQRISAAPEVPTFEEAGLRGYEAVGWFGAVAPAGTPKDIINRLNTEIRNALAAPDVKERALTAGAEPHATSPEEFAAYIREETKKWEKWCAPRGSSSMTKSPVIDVHTHMLTNEWVASREGRRPVVHAEERRRRPARDPSGRRAIRDPGAQHVRLGSAHRQHGQGARRHRGHLAHMPERVLGSAEVSLKAAQIANDDMAKAQKTWPARIRWFASLPWQHERLALEELKRACDNGAVA